MSQRLEGAVFVGASADAPRGVLVDAKIPRVTSERWRGAIAGAFFGVAGTALVMAPTWAALARTWRDDAAFLWCWLVIPAVLYGLVQRLRPKEGGAVPQ